MTAVTFTLPFPDKLLWPNGRGARPEDRWSSKDIEVLKARYASASSTKDLRLDDLALLFGRHKSNICRKARALGLTAKTPPPGRKNRRKYASIAEGRAAVGEAVRKRFADGGHPRGMAGKTHTQATKDQIGLTSVARAAARTPDERAAIATKMMKTKIERHGSIAPPQESRGTWKAGWREIGGYRKYYRSRWEANYARYLQWLKERGEIQDWKHEPETFWFEAIKRGVRSYLPDFRVWENNGSTPLHEVKGWMDARSKTTLKRMAKYHPGERIILIKERDYNAIARTAGPLIADWEKSERAGRW